MANRQLNLKSGRWINLGDVNPREQGGCFVKYDKKHDEFQIVETRSMEDYDEVDYRYMISYATIDEDDIDDPSFIDFAGAADAPKEQRLLYLLTAYMNYYGGDSTETTNNYWGSLKPFGINQKSVT